MSESNTNSTERIQISLKGVTADLANGVTRKEGDAGYSPERGSIQEKYNLTKAEVDRLFKHPKLKGLRVRIPLEDSFDIVDDLEMEEETPSSTVSYGQPSASAVERLRQPEATESTTVTEESATTEI